ncbi:twin transmembrane helix small protein [Microbaculum marinum]|uniref:Twin transmembrane helix small protein n=1 Tax=Microbaculum marinum TaxID=1764581 RepID=A0AAW9RAE2_9HYPH
MSEVFVTYALPVALGVVFLVLLAGLWNMMRGGSPNTSQKLMRWRVGLQFLAICVAVVTIWLMGRS